MRKWIAALASASLLAVPAYAQDKQIRDFKIGDYFICREVITRMPDAELTETFCDDQTNGPGLDEYTRKILWTGENVSLTRTFFIRDIVPENEKQPRGTRSGNNVLYTVTIPRSDPHAYKLEMQYQAALKLPVTEPSKNE